MCLLKPVIGEKLSSLEALAIRSSTGKIFEVWQHNSYEGRLYRDSRELTYYEIKVQGTSHMKILLKGAGCKS